MYLSYIPDEDLLRHTENLIKACRRGQQSASDDIYRGGIDPFSALVDSSLQGISLSDWLEQEKSRKAQKSLQNAIGTFHQDILGSVNGWKNAGLGGSYDVINDSLQIIAEIKNKYNTLNSEGQISVYEKLSRHLDYGSSGYTAYYVTIIPKSPKPFDRPFTPVQKKIPRPSREDLRIIDGSSFYALATGQKNALEQLYDLLPALFETIGDIKLPDIIAFKELFDRLYK